MSLAIVLATLRRSARTETTETSIMSWQQITGRFVLPLSVVCLLVTMSLGLASAAPEAPLLSRRS